MPIVRIAAESTIAFGSVNVWHWDLPGVAETTEVNAAITALDTFYEAIKTHLQPAVITAGTRVVTVDESPNRVIAGTPLSTTTTGTDNAPRQAAVVCKLLTPFIGKSYSGRVYLGPLYKSAIATDGRQVSSGTISTVQTALTTLVGTTTSGIQLVVWSRKLNAATPVTGSAVNGVIGTQRGRLN